jgi:hypothetical protein
MVLRLGLLMVALLGLSWFQFGQNSSAAALAQRTWDIADARPPRSVLILGNSRTFTNDMPAMLRKIADSLDSTTKFQIESHTKPGYRLEDHWSDRRSRSLLVDTWDAVLIQAESGSQASIAGSESFKTFGAKLAGVAKVSHGQPTLIVNWPYDPSVFAGTQGYKRDEHLAFLRNINADLAGEAHLDRINLVGVWEAVRVSHPEIALTIDGNHPSVAGTYIYALATYRGLTGHSVEASTYVPRGLKADAAALLRRAVDESLTLAGT